MDLVSIETIAFIADGNYSSKYPRNEEFISEGVPFIRANNFENSTISDKDMLFISEEKHSTITKGHLKYNDVLITTRGNIGKTALVPKKHENSNINAQIVLLRCKENCYPKYLMHCFSIPFVKNQLDNNTTGTALKQLSVGNLRKIQIPLPPLETQKAIAEKLDKADALRKKDQELLKQYDDLAQAIFIDMFGDPVQNEKGWEVKKLKDISLKILSGNTPKGGSENYVSNGIMFFRSQNVWKNKLDLEDIAYIDDLTHSKMKNSSLKNKDILMTKTGRINTENSSLGRASIYYGEDDKANINGHVYLIRLTEDVINEFVLFILISKSYRDLIRSVCVGGIDKRQLNKEHIEDFPIIFPSISLQQKFVEKFKNIEAQKAIVKQQTEESENLFQALLQQCFNFN